MKGLTKYRSVIRYGKSGTQDLFQKGDIISISEKIDGANASFRIDNEDESGVSCYSRRQLLDMHNTLSGFYNFVHINIVPIKNMLNENYIYYGEWLCSHHVQYKQEHYTKWYMFSIWDVKQEQYLDDADVIKEAQRLGLQTVNFLYIGEYISFEHLMSFVGKSDISLESNKGEGVVVKNTVCRRSDNKQVFVKLVSQDFCEVMNQKPPKEPNIDFTLRDKLQSVLTKARIRKGIFRMIEDNLLHENYTIKDIGLILRFLGNDIFDDILKEEPEMFESYEQDVVKRYIGKLLPLTVKEIINER